MIAVEGRLPLARTLSPADQTLFDRLYWKLDGAGIMEFTYKDELHVHSKTEVLADVTRLAKLAGVEREVLDPEGARLRNLGMKRESYWGSLHLHGSRTGEDLSEFANLKNQEIFLRRLKLGITSDITGQGQHLFTPNTKDRGLVRALRSRRRGPWDRMETRVHHEPLEFELDQLEKHLTDPEAASRDLKKKIREHLTIDVVSFAGKHSTDSQPIRARFLSQIIEQHEPWKKSALARQAASVATASRDPSEVARALNVVRALGSHRDLFTFGPILNELVNSESALAILARESPAAFGTIIQSDSGLRDRAVIGLSNLLNKENQLDRQMTYLRLLENIPTSPTENRLLALSLERIVKNKSWPEDEQLVVKLAARYGLKHLEDGWTTGLKLLDRIQNPNVIEEILTQLKEVQAPRDPYQRSIVFEKLKRFAIETKWTDEVLGLVSNISARHFPSDPAFQTALAARWFGYSTRTDPNLDRAILNGAHSLVLGGDLGIVDILNRTKLDTGEIQKTLSEALTHPGKFKKFGLSKDRLAAARALYLVSNPGSRERSLAAKEIRRVLGQYDGSLPSGAHAHSSIRAIDLSAFKDAEARRAVQIVEEFKMTDSDVVRELVRLKNRSSQDFQMTKSIEGALSHVPIAEINSRTRGCGSGIIAGMLRRLLGN